MVSHVLAQSGALLKWFQKQPIRFAIIIEVIDDTNIWVRSKPKLDPVAEEEGAQANNSDILKKGTVKQTAPLFGFLQRIAVRRANEGGVVESAQVHVPSQALPKASYSATLHRLRPWACLSSAGSGMWVGGQDLQEEFAKIPIKIIVQLSVITFQFWLN